MKRIRPSFLIFIITIMFIVNSCTDDSDAFKENLGNMAERMKNAPGRTGILAEEKLYSCFYEELNIRDFFQDRKGGFFVDVGCAWPIKSSNTYYLEKHLGWTGIGIDALSEYAPGWKEKRPNSKFFTFLVTGKSGGYGTFYKSEDTGLSSTNQKKAEGVPFKLSYETKKISVPMITLNDLLDKVGVKKIDLLSLDIEGNELEAFAGFDLERFSPELIVVEAFGIKDAVKKHLNKYGYQQLQRYVPYDFSNMYFCREQKSEIPPGQ